MVKYKILYKIEKDEYSKVIYGDSVTSDTPILLRNPHNGWVTIIKISKIAKDWKKYPGFKLFDFKADSEKFYSTTKLQCWTDKGWSDIKKVIKHKTNKKIYEVLTQDGYVKVTEDHSLLDSTKNIVKPKDCTTETILLSRKTVHYMEEYNGLSNDNCYMIGLMLADGEYSEVPDEILNGTVEQAEAFLKGYNSCTNDYVSDLIKAGLYYLYNKIGKPVSLKLKKGIVIFTDSIVKTSGKIIKIQPIFDLKDENVYDIETEVGSFQAGIGDLIVKNTDSCMIELNTKSLKRYKNLVEEYKEVIKITKEEQMVLDDYKTKAIEEAFIEGQKIAKQVTDSLFKKPINLEFEKVYTNFLILSKKRYIGNYYGSSPYKIDFVEKKGVVLKRRDNPEIVKKIYNGVVNPLLEHGKRGVSMSVEFLKKELQKIMNNQVDLKDLVITKSLAKGYGSINKKGELVLGANDYKNMNIPHVALAHKMRQRDPGSAPNIGDRINYIFIDIPDKPSAKLYEKVEDLDVAIANKNNIDYLYYITNQVHNPVCEILKILVSNYEKIFDDATQEYTKKRQEAVKMEKIKKTIPKGQISILKWLKPKDL